MDKLKVQGKYKIEHIRDGKVIGVHEGKNLVTNVGKNSLLDIMFGAVTQIATWYVGLVDNVAFSAFAAADTMASHAGWAESVAYSDATRPVWDVDAAASQAISNSTPVTFNINASAVIKGIFVTSVNTKSGATGTLWNGVAFTSNISVTSGDQLKVTYSVSV